VGLRLFFALWPQASLRALLAQHAQSWRFAPPAKPTLPDKLHLTLLFMDGVPNDRLQDLVHIGAAVAAAAKPFALRLDQAAVWPQGGIAHLAPSHAPRELTALHAALLQAVALAGVPCDKRSFRPHLTLARHATAGQAPQAFAPVAWQAGELSLVQSMLGSGRYAVLDRWEFAGATVPAAQSHKSAAG
jgi:2'-5' RNA ligase